MPRVYIGVGSNIDPEANIPEALRMLAEFTPIIAISTFYRTAPVGSPGSPDFVNGVIAIDTEIEPCALKHDVLPRIEDALGRMRSSNKYESRTIDLDIVVYGNLVIHEGGLVIPDPYIAERAFLAAPLLELDAEMTLPGSGERLADLVARMRTDEMTALEYFTQRLRQEINLEP